MLPAELVCLPPEELASDAKRAENQAIREKKLFDSAPSAAKQVGCCVGVCLGALWGCGRGPLASREKELLLDAAPLAPRRVGGRALKSALWWRAAALGHTHLTTHPTHPAHHRPQATTDQFQCGKCRQRKTTYYQMQTRSADEPVSPWGTLQGR